MSDVRAVFVSSSAMVALSLFACASDVRPSTVRSTKSPVPGDTAAAPSGEVAAPSSASASNSNTTLIVPTDPTPASPASGAMTPATGPAAASSRDPIRIDDCGDPNPAGLSATDVQMLRAGGAPDGLRILYPYDGTVFPRGMIAPDLLFELQGGDPEALFVHIQSQAFEYSACLPPTAAGQLSLVQQVWDQAGQRTFGKDDVTQSSSRRGGKVKSSGR